MSCASCSAKIEKAVSKVQGVDKCSVNLLLNTLTIEGKASSESIFKAVQDAGYGIDFCESHKNLKNYNSNESFESEQKNLKNSSQQNIQNIKKFCFSLFFLLILLYFSMGKMLGIKYPPFLDENYMALGILQLIFSGLVLTINQKFFINGTKGFAKKTPNMDSLVSLGSGVSFLWSIWTLLLMSNYLIAGNISSCKHLFHNLYFESAAMILVLISFGKILEERAKGKTTDAIKKLINLAPKTAIIIKNGIEIEIPASELKKDDIFIVRPGFSIPADGIILEGRSSIDESSLTGESIPIDKEKDSEVFAGTLNQNGFLKCKASKPQKETALSKIIQMVQDASSSKAPIARIADKVSSIFVPTIIGIAITVTLIWLFIFEKDIAFALEKGICILVISCPCSLGLATPVAIMVASGVGAKNGILFKTAQSLEETGRINTVVLDKTGTITKGKPVVQDIIPAQKVEINKLLRAAFFVEQKSEHPLAKAVCTYCKEIGLKTAQYANENVKTQSIESSNNHYPSSDSVISAENSDFLALPGCGAKATIKQNGKTIEILAGNKKFICNNIDTPLSPIDETNLNIISANGKTPLLFCKNRKFLGTIGIADELKENTQDSIKKLKSMGLSIYMLTGDNEKTAAAIAKKAGIENIISGVLPWEKAEKIKNLQKNGKVLMAGDGINDAPALTQADIGIGMGSGTDIAIDSAQIILVNSKIENIPAAIELSRKTLGNIRQNLFWAFFYNILGIPLAAGAFISFFGWTLTPMAGAAMMSLSSLCVVLNALRLNLWKSKLSKKQNKINSTGENMNIKKTMKIEGMMCSHCEGRVKKILENIENVIHAEVNHKKGTAIIELSADIPNDELKNAVDSEYKVISIE